MSPILEFIFWLLLPVLIMNFIVFPITDASMVGEPDKLNCKQLYHWMTNSTVHINAQLLGEINGNYIARCMR